MSVILDEYQKIVGDQVISELRQMATILKGKKILHINSTRCGGGVAEILSMMVQLTNALGIETAWEILTGNAEFFQCTKNMHNGLQGRREISFPTHLIRAYEDVTAENAQRLTQQIEWADIVFIHDPQPASLIKFFRSRKNKWIWRCHIDLSTPKRYIWDYLRRSIALHDASIFSLPDFVQPLPHPIYLIPPSIDPLSDKNKELKDEEIASVVSSFGVNPERAILLQVSRFDYFKDPLGVIDSYRRAKKFQPNIQLILAGGGAQDDPEGETVLNEVRRAAKNDPDIHVLYISEVSHRMINALQRSATIIIQKSTREGFGLTVAEGLWKRKPVIGGNTGGIRLQVANHHTGFLVNTPEGAALRIRYLLQNPTLARAMGEQGHRTVLDNFLITRHLRDYLTLTIALLYPEKQGRIELHQMGYKQ